MECSSPASSELVQNLLVSCLYTCMDLKSSVIVGLFIYFSMEKKRGNLIYFAISGRLAYKSAAKIIIFSNQGVD